MANNPGGRHGADKIHGATTGDRGGSQPKYTPNDDRGIVKNPTHPSYDVDKTHQHRQKSGG